MSYKSSDAMAWFKILCAGIILINVTYLHYVFDLVDRYKQKKMELAVYYFINAIFIFMNFNSLLYSRLEPRFGLGLWPNPTMLFHVYLAFWLWECVYGLILLLRNLRVSTGMKKEQIKYSIVAACIAFIGGASNWPLWYGVNFPPYANVLIVVSICLQTYAIIRYQLMDIKVVLTRAGIFLIVYTLVLGIPLVIGFRSNFGLLSFIALFILATIGPILYPVMQKKAENMLLARQREYQRILHESAVLMLREHNLGRLLKLIIYGMRTIVKVEYVAIFLNDKDECCYKLMAASTGAVFPDGARFGYEDPVVDLLNTQKRPLMYEEISHLFNDHIKQSIHLLVPSFIYNTLLGFMALGEKKNKSFYTRDDLRTFDILSHQTALAIENCMFIDERKKTQDRLFQAEKLALIGGMAEGVAHQIKNRLSSFSLASRQMQTEIHNFRAKYPDVIERMPDLKEIFDSLDEIGELMIDNVKRTDNVIQGIVNYTLRDSKNNYFSDHPFKEIVDGAIELAKIKNCIEELPVTVDVDPGDTVYGVMRQILESVYNMLDNSYEAIEAKKHNYKNLDERMKYNPSIHIKLIRRPDSSIIEINDNGIGIAEEDKNKIFAPYFSTKTSYKSKSVSGIGLHIVQRMIEENHRGKIWFTSEFMKGTSFFIQLPAKNNALNAAQ